MTATPEPGAVLTALRPGGSLAAGECFVIDLSTTGAGLLYPGFLHGRTECALHLRTIDGEPMTLPVSVMCCRLTSKSIHSLGVRFCEPVHVKNFIPARQWAKRVAGAEVPRAENLDYRVLIVGFDEVEQHLIRHFLPKVSNDLQYCVVQGRRSRPRAPGVVRCGHLRRRRR